MALNHTLSLLRGGLLCGAALIFTSAACGTSDQVNAIDDDLYDEPTETSGTGDDPSTVSNGAGGAPTTAGNGGSTDDDGSGSGGAPDDPTSGAGGDPDPSSGSGGTPGPQNDCCAASDAAGCVDQAVQACVCAEDTFCCDTEWDEQCIAEVDEFGCGVCDSNPTPPVAKADCCDENPGGLGCLDTAVEACVCAADAYCCSDEWDATCAAEVESLGCGSCGGQQQNPPPAKGDCCEDNPGSMGCVDVAVESCVCAADDYCCDTEWDQVCADQVDSLGCGSCGGNQQQQTPPPAPAKGDCCTDNPGTTGCLDATVEACVCASDDYCCDVEWDQFCADEVDTFGCGSCGNQQQQRQQQQP